MPSSGWSASSAAAPSARAAASRASAASASASARSRSMRQPGVQAAVLALGQVEMGRGQLARRHLAGAEPGGHLVGVEAGQLGGHGRSGPSVAAEDRRHDDEVAVARRRRSPGPPRPAATAGRRRRAGCSRARSSGRSARCGRSGRVGQDRVLVEDVVELALEPGELLVGQPEPGEVGDVLDVGARQGGHGPMIAAIRRPAATEAAADLEVGDGRPGRPSAIASWHRFASCARPARDRRPLASSPVRRRRAVRAGRPRSVDGAG